MSRGELIHKPVLSHLGDSALVLTFADSVHLPAVARIRRLRDWLEAERPLAYAESVPAAGSLTVLFDPAKLAEEGPVEWMNRLWEAWRVGSEREAKQGQFSDCFEIPVCYHGGFAPDAAAVCASRGIEWEEVVRLHQSAEFVVLQLGFAPGFPYLHGLPEALRLPRKETPALHVPRGAVGVANELCCVYPVEISGGWHVIGRTPWKLFDPRADHPARLGAGDRVRFRAVSEEEFRAIEKEEWR